MERGFSEKCQCLTYRNEAVLGVKLLLMVFALTEIIYFIFKKMQNQKENLCKFLNFVSKK